MEEYELQSGQRCNWEKCKGWWGVEGEDPKMTWMVTEGEWRYLGIIIGPSATEDKNLKIVWERARAVMQWWEHRLLSLAAFLIALHDYSYKLHHSVCLFLSIFFLFLCFKIFFQKSFSLYFFNDY